MGKSGTDLFLFKNMEYLIAVEYLSNIWEIDYLADTTSTTLIKKNPWKFVLPAKVFWI